MSKISKSRPKKTKDKSSFFHKTPKTDLEKWISSVIPKIVDAYGIGKITVVYATSPMDSSVYIDDDNNEGMLSIKYSQPYKMASIRIHPAAQRMWKSGDKEILIHGITHEIAHIITEPLSKIAETRHATRKGIVDASEEVTESVAQIGREVLRIKNPELFKF